MTAVVRTGLGSPARRRRDPTLAVVAVAAAAAGLLAALHPLGIAAVVVGAGAALVARNVDLATGLALALIFTNSPAVLARELGLGQAAAFVVLGLLSIPAGAAVARTRHVVGTRPMAAMLALLVAFVVSTFSASEGPVAVEETKTFAYEGVAVFVLLLQAIRTRAALALATAAVLGSAAGLVLLTVFQQATGSHSSFGGYAQIPLEYLVRGTPPRPGGPVGDPNYFAQLLVAAVPLGLLVAIRAPSGSARAGARIAAGLAVLGIAYTGSRGAALAFAVTMVGMAVMRYVSWRTLLGVAAVVGLVLSAVPAYGERLGTLTSLTSGVDEDSDLAADTSVRSRATEMMAALSVYVDHPVTGVGPGGFPYRYQEYAERVGTEIRAASRFGARAGETPRREAHNLFLGLAADLGTIGLGAFLAVTWCTLRQLSVGRRLLASRDPSLADTLGGYELAVIAYLSAGMFLTLAFGIYLWALLGVGAAAAAVARSEHERSWG